MRLSKGLLHCTQTGRHHCRPKQTPKMTQGRSAMIDGWNCEEGGFWCQALNGTKRTASATRRLILIITSLHCNHPWNQRRKNRIKHPREDLLLPSPLPLSLSPQIGGTDCGEMNKLTWLFWARRQTQTCQWSRGEWQAMETPQRPSRSLFFSGFLYSLISGDLNFSLPVSIIEALLFVATMPFTVCYKCLW